jgi:hypothetical protein
MGCGCPPFTPAMEIFVLTTMPSRSEHLRDLAWECRQLAAAAHDQKARFDLLVVAEHFERLAQMHKWGPELLEPASVRSNQNS